MAIQKGDFVEIEYVGKIKENGEVFDTNIKEVAKSNGFEEIELKPFVFPVGFNILPQGLDEDIINKNEGENYKVEIKPEKAFGKRDPSKIRMIPTKYFEEQKIRPYKGLKLSLDGQLVKVLSSDQSRTLIDFNHPLAGKEIIYEYKINRKVEDINEKFNSLQDFFFKKRFDFEVKDSAIILKVDERFKPFVSLLLKNFEEMLNLKIELETIKEENSK